MEANETIGITKSVEVIYVRVDHQETPLPSKDDGCLQLDENSAAVKIQAHYRGYRVRKMLKNQEENMADSNEKEQLYVTGNAVQLQREEGNLREDSNVEEYSESPLISMVAHIEDLNPHSEEQEEGLKIGTAGNESLEVTESVNVLPSVVVAQNLVEAALQEVRGGVKAREKGKETPSSLQEEHENNVGSVSEQEEEPGDNFNAHKDLMDSTTVQENITDDKPQEEENRCDQRNDTDDKPQEEENRCDQRNDTDDKPQEEENRCDQRNDTDDNPQEEENRCDQRNDTDDNPQEEENQCDQRNDTDDEKMQSSLQNHVADTKVLESSCLRATEKTENNRSQRLEQVDVVGSQYPNEAAIEDSVIQDRHTSTEVEVPQVAE